MKADRRRTRLKFRLIYIGFGLAVIAIAVIAAIYWKNMLDNASTL